MAELRTPRKDFICALEKRNTYDRVLHFELVFFLTMESLGTVHPLHRTFSQWDQMSDSEKNLQLRSIAESYIAVARKYEHSAIFVHGQDILEVEKNEFTMRILEHIRDLSGMEFFLAMHRDVTYAVPGGDNLVNFTLMLADVPQRMKDGAQAKVDLAIKNAEKFQEHSLLDGFCLCSDYCFNSGPFLSPPMFDEFITPYLKQLITGYREMGFYTIKHTDGNIMPILDSLVDCKPHALHSLDPQGGIDIAKIKQLIGNKICLIGNVNCGLMDTGTDQEVIESAKYALLHGMPGGGYIFSTSNCIYTGMPLRRYDLILEVWRKYGNYNN